MKKKDRFIIFDFDGVIVDSFKVAFTVTAMNQPGLSEDEYRSFYEGNINSSRKKLDDKFWENYIPRAKEAKLFPEMKKVVQDLSRSYQMSIVSSSRSDLILDILNRESMANHFTDILGNDVNPSKVEKIKMLFEKYGAAPEGYVFITDTLGDIREGAHAGVGSIAVTWGFHSPEVLREGSIFRLVDKPDELSSAVSDYFAI